MSKGIFKETLKAEYEERKVKYDIEEFNKHKNTDCQLDEDFHIPFFGNENAGIVTCNINPCKSIKEPSLYKILSKNDLTDFDKIYDFLSNF